MLEGMSGADIRRMPPFPFPERLFPAGTFPRGMRFSADFKLPPSVEELLERSGPEALHALFAGGPGASTRDGGAFERNGTGSESEGTGSDSSDWHTDEAGDSDDGSAYVRYVRRGRDDTAANID